MEDIIKSEVNKLNTALTNYLKSGPKSIQEFKIDCSKLDERFFNEDIRHSLEFKEMFQELEKTQNNPCLYVFEIESEILTKDIIENLINFGNQTEKVIPKLKTKIPENSKTLYVGKANNLVWGRLITHLGFHTHKNNGNPRASINHGLQLFFWAKQLSLQLKYTVIEFENDMKEVLPVLEKQLAFELNPIIGKHK
jgi:hypothetical protein